MNTLFESNMNMHQPDLYTGEERLKIINWDFKITDYEVEDLYSMEDWFIYDILDVNHNTHEFVFHTRTMIESEFYPHTGIELQVAKKPLMSYEYEFEDGGSYKVAPNGVDASRFVSLIGEWENNLKDEVKNFLTYEMKLNLPDDLIQDVQKRVIENTHAAFDIISRQIDEHTI